MAMTTSQRAKFDRMQSEFDYHLAEWNRLEAEMEAIVDAYHAKRAEDAAAGLPYDVTRDHPAVADYLAPGGRWEALMAQRRHHSREMGVLVRARRVLLEMEEREADGGDGRCHVAAFTPLGQPCPVCGEVLTGE